MTDLETQVEAMCAEFERIMWDTPQVLLHDLKVGDYVLYLVSFSRVTKITKTHVETTQDKHPLYWTHQTMGRITEADARYVATNWDAWRVWVIAGKEGMLKCALKAVRS
jgi:hypothetical protein